MAEWLGNGLQNRVQRFESARDLERTLNFFKLGVFILYGMSEVHFSEKAYKIKIGLKSQGSFGIVLTILWILEKSARDLERTLNFFKLGVFILCCMSEVHFSEKTHKIKIGLKSQGSFGIVLTILWILEKSARDLERTLNFFKLGVFILCCMSEVHFSEKTHKIKIGLKSQGSFGIVLTKLRFFQNSALDFEDLNYEKH